MTLSARRGELVTQRRGSIQRTVLALHARPAAEPRRWAKEAHVGPIDDITC